MGLADKHRLLESVDVAALVDCGCQVLVWKDGSGAEIEYCPLHRSAQKMLDALNKIDDYFETVFQVGNLISDAEIHLRGLVKVTIKNIAQMEGGENAR